MKTITQSDLEMLRYFWENKGDITRWVNFEAIEPALRLEYPEILSAWEAHRTAERAMSAILRGVAA